ncbi:hypothetical protein GO730_26820 [Spirosoma sp. HMF3257]|uniref:Uncharacterized protein n=1 Tax=Spirosoma telluris TaxID=2183553 RepID=A0A327NQ81_9BACT|nr:hypothetical protein [Spirosoma telluris]RAI76873.1 hypothetical protein HMF3257_26740 [Spirosoma telluris]
MGTTAVAASTLNFTYDPASATTPMFVSVATSPTGPYTPVGTLPGSSGWVTNRLTIPVGARYVQVTNPGTAPTTAFLDAITYTAYVCVTPASTSCAVGQQSLSYPTGAQGVGATTVQ